jgi:sugar/nucleoside kinase (ribokinase family)
VHATSEAACIVDGKYYQTPGPYTATPNLTTGAGDNFNAGFVEAVLLGLDPSEWLVMGTAASGFYVRAMRSAELGDFPKFLEIWEANAGKDFNDFK